MPPLNWDAFAQLPGSAQENFERLCRALVRRHYGQFGVFAALAAQPGVEFHLKLLRPCPLGDAGRWYGWQCRWYDLAGGHALGASRRKKIKEALEITHRELPGLTDWVLWTRRPLTKGDQKWFYGLSSHMELALWTGEDVEHLLSGEAEILRATYFGELVLTAQTLAQRHRESTARIKARWQPEVHAAVDAERRLRRILGESGGWEDLAEAAAGLRTMRARLDQIHDIPDGFADALVSVRTSAEKAAVSLEMIHAAIATGDLDHLRSAVSGCAAVPTHDFWQIPRRLRATRHLSGLLVTDAVEDVRQAHALIDRVERVFSVRLVAVVADAGNGKTQLAAQLTMETAGRPAGILLHGRDLHAGNTLDDLARRVVLSGMPIGSMEALLEAVDSAGQRSGRRLPVVVDGLNEAEDPREWKPLLASLSEALRRFPYVLFVCTLRTPFIRETLPGDILQLEIRDFGEDATDAILRYFEFYKIDYSDADVPLDLLRHPLTLRIYCEVANPTRENVVGVEAIPTSLTGLFDSYLKRVAERIDELSARTRRYYEHDVRSALNRIGAALWENHARGLDFDALRQLLDDDQRWDQSLVRALEENGALLRMPEDGGKSQMVPIFDALGGHLVADAILTRQGQAGIGPWLRDEQVRAKLVGSYEDQHPFASDIFTALAGLMPRRLHRQQLWQLVAESERSRALRLAADLEATYLDALTVEELVGVVRTQTGQFADMFERLRQTRAVPSHPLNANFFDRVLRTWPVAERDLRWTEWVRRRYSAADIRRFSSRWQRSRHQGRDVLWARWLMWMLTSTARELRDEATRALYWFGRVSPAELFSLTIESLSIDDSYVAERMIAASYGVAMAHQQNDEAFAAPLKAFLDELARAFIGEKATHPTNHWLIRLYVRGVFEFARMHYPDSVPSEAADGIVSFAAGPDVTPLEEDDERGEEVRYTLHSDFANYTVGALFDDRHNYDMEHTGHRAALAYIRGVVWSLGWRRTLFARAEEDIGSSTWGSRVSRPPAERYAKKYSWIGFHMYAGQLEQRGELRGGREHLAEVDIDPSFPEQPAPDVSLALPWLSPEVTGDEDWIAGTTSVPAELLYRQKIGTHDGPWVAIHGSIRTVDKVLGRSVFALISALAVPESEADAILALLNGAKRLGGRLSDAPGDPYTFAGEIPWSSVFAREEGTETDDEDADEKRSLYIIRLQNSGRRIELEGLAHRYAWESHHSETNAAGGSFVPSKRVSTALSMRGEPQTFDQTLADRSRASVTVGAPVGFSGNLLYMREDLIARYLGTRRLLWVAWGERQLYGAAHEPPEWYVAKVQQADNVWRVVQYADELVPVLRPLSATTARRGRAKRKAVRS